MLAIKHEGQYAILLNEEEAEKLVDVLDTYDAKMEDDTQYEEEIRLANTLGSDLKLLIIT